MELEGLQFKVEGLSGGSGASDIKQLASALETLKGSLPSTGKIKNIITSLQRLSVATSKLKFDSTSISNLGKALSSLNGAKVSSTIGDNIRNIGEAARTITDADVARIRELADALSGLKDIGNVQIKMSAGKGSASADTGKSSDGLGEAVDENVQDVGSTIEEADASARSFFSTLKNGFSSALAGATSLTQKLIEMSANGIGRLTSSAVKLGGALAGNLAKLPMYFGKQLAGGIGKAVGKVGELFAGLKRIAMYRAMRTVIKMITEGFTTGLKNVYQYSKLVGTQFASSMDQIATSSLYLKNSLGAMAAPLLQLLAPAIDFVIDKFVSLLNVVNMFIARLTGSSVATVAKKSFSSWGDEAEKSAGKTKKAVKEIRRTLLGFDEINRLDAPTDSGSGGGGGGGASTPDYGSMFEQVPIDSEISEFVDNLKEAFKNGDWETLGTLIGGKFNEIVEKIPWSKMGRKVGKGVNGVVTTAYYALKEANFTKLGGKFSAFLNNALAEIDTNKLGRLLVRALTVLPDLIIGALTKLNWGQVAEKASDFFIGIYDEAADWLEEIDWAELTDTLFDNLILFLKKVKWKKIIQAAARFLGAAAGAAASVLTAIGLKIGKLVLKGLRKAKQKLSEAKKWLKEKVIKPIQDGAKKGDLLGGLKTAGTNILEGVKKGFSKVTWKVWELIGKPFVEAFKKAFGITGEDGATLDEIKELGKNIWEGIKNGVKAALEALGNFWDWIKGILFGNNDDASDDKQLASASVGVGLTKDGWTSVQQWFTDLHEKAAEFVDGVKVKLGKAWDTVTSWFSGLGEKAGEFADGVKVKLGKAWSTVSSWFSGLGEKAGEFADGVKVKLGKAWTTVSSWFSGLGETAGTFLNGVIVQLGKGWTAVSTWFSGLGEKAGEFANGVLVMLGRGWATIAQWFSGLTSGKDTTSYEGILVNLKKGWSTIKSWFSNLMSGGEDSDSVELKATVKNNTSSGVIDTLKDAWNTITGNPTPTLTGLVKNNSGTGVISTLKDAWTSITGSPTPTLTGTVKNNSASKVIDTLKDAWAKITGNPSPTLTGTVKNKSESKAIDTLKEAWAKITGNPSPTLTGTVKNSSASGVISTLENAWAKIKGSPKPILTGTVKNKSAAGAISALTSAWTKITAGTRKSVINATVVDHSKKGVITSLFNVLKKIIDVPTNKTITVTTKYKSGGTNDRKDGNPWQPAVGGVYSSGHFRYSIPQYASGGLPNHGTMFVAGEAGAEVVGHINGRTEVLNASQIASAIHAAVLSAMQQANNGQSPMLNVTVRTENNEVLARAVARGQRSLDSRLNPMATY